MSYCASDASERSASLAGGVVKNKCDKNDEVFQKRASSKEAAHAGQQFHMPSIFHKYFSLYFVQIFHVIRSCNYNK